MEEVAERGGRRRWTGRVVKKVGGGAFPVFFSNYVFYL